MLLSRCGAARGAATAQSLKVSIGRRVASRVCSVVERTRFDRRDGYRRGVLFVEEAHVVVEQPWDHATLTSLSKNELKLSLGVDSAV